MLSNGVEWAHDARMPLQLILSSAQMLRQTLADPGEDAGTYLDILVESVGQLRRIMEAALEERGRGAPAEAPRMRDGDLPAFLRRLCAQCVPCARQMGVLLSWGGNVASLAMALDEDMLSRVVLNLISNALRFTPPGGRIRVSWRAMGDFAEIRVSDSGAGIAPERLPYVFLEGESEGGHGRGLPICRRLMSAMGGELTARSTPGRGSDFILRLPVRSAAAHLTKTVP